MKSFLLLLSLSFLFVGCGEDVVISYRCESILPDGYYNCYLSDDVGGVNFFYTCTVDEQSSVSSCVNAATMLYYPGCYTPHLLNDTIPTSGSFECEEE